jgi:hypothetical protein
MCKDGIKPWEQRVEFYDVVCDCVRTKETTPGVCARCKNPLGFDEISMCNNCEENAL